MPAETAGKTRLLTLADLDGRTAAAKSVRETIAQLEGDLGGGEHLSTQERELVRGVALLSGMLTDTATRWLSGEPIDPVAKIQQTQMRLILSRVHGTLKRSGESCACSPSY
jgi:hypothetical protein